MRQAADLVVRHRHRLHPPLPRRGEHRGERLLEAGLRRALEPGLREVTAGQRLVVGEVAHHRLHVLQRPLETPDVVEALGDLERDPHGAHQHHLVHPVRVLGGQPQRDAAAEAVAHQVRLLDAEGVHDPEGLVGPRVEAVVRLLRPLRVAEPDHVRGDAAEVLTEHRQHAAPVGVRRDARARAVDEDDGLVPGAGLQVVGADAVGVDVPADRGVGGRGVLGARVRVLRAGHATVSSRRRSCVVRCWFDDVRGRAVSRSTGRRGPPRSTAWAYPRPRRSVARRPPRRPRAA